MEKYPIFVDGKTQYCQDISTAQLDLHILGLNLYWNSMKSQSKSQGVTLWILTNWFKFFRERQKTHNRQHNFKGEEES